MTSTAESFLSLLLDGPGAATNLEKTTPAAAALEALKKWRQEPVMDKDTAAPLIYVLLRTSVLRLLETLPGAPLSKLARAEDPHLGANDGMAKLLAIVGGKQWSALSNWVKQQTPELLPKGYDWPQLVREAFLEAVKLGVERFGSDVSSWRYGSVHKSAPKHAAASLLQDGAKRAEWNAKPFEMGGDADTVQAAGGWEEVTLQSVARFVGVDKLGVFLGND